MDSVKVEGIPELQLTLKTYFKKVSIPPEKGKLLAAAGAEIRKEASKAPTPKSKKTHYYYPRKRKRISIEPGNLQRSMKVYRTRDGDVEVGPRVKRSLLGVSEIGKTAATSSGYYAHMIFKSAANFRTKILEPAMSRAEQKAIKAVQKAFEKFHNQNTR
jgi:hypothetical protein